MTGRAVLPALAEGSGSDGEGQLGPLPHSPPPPRRQEGAEAGARRRHGWKAGGVAAPGPRRGVDLPPSRSSPGDLTEYLLYTCQASLLSPFCGQGHQTKRGQQGLSVAPRLRAEFQRSRVHHDSPHLLSPQPCEHLCLRTPFLRSRSVKEGSLEKEGVNSKDSFYLLSPPQTRPFTPLSLPGGVPPSRRLLTHRHVSGVQRACSPCLGSTPEAASKLTCCGCSGNGDRVQEQTRR